MGDFEAPHSETGLCLPLFLSSTACVYVCVCVCGWVDGWVNQCVGCAVCVHGCVFLCECVCIALCVCVSVCPFFFLWLMSFVSTRFCGSRSLSLFSHL